MCFSFNSCNIRPRDVGAVVPEVAQPLERPIPSERLTFKMTNTHAAVVTWSPVVERIAAGSEAAFGELYLRLRSIRFFFGRQIGPDRAEDAYHNLILDLVGAIKKGDLQEPEALPAYAMTIARRRLYVHIGEAIRERQAMAADSTVLTCPASEDPEQLALRSEREAIATRVLRALPARERETLTRFYFDGESAEAIQTSMGMTPTQFRLLKSRAKKRYAELVHQLMNRLPCRKPAASASAGAYAQQATA
jgi:RNA polymerase sigma factor (sigma-70 family)